MTRIARHIPSAGLPRERLFEHGVEAVTDAELIALVLRTGQRSDPALAQAERLLVATGGIEGLARAGVTEILRVAGLGPAKAASIAGAVELGRRATARRLRDGTTFRTSLQVFEHFRSRFAGVRKEELHVLLLDAKHRKLRGLRVSEGSLTASIVHPREVFAPAVRESAAAVLVVHNHPSGDPAPSPEDVEVTRRLRQAGETLGIRLLDHVIVGAEAHFSFADAGW